MFFREHLSIISPHLIENHGIGLSVYTNFEIQSTKDLFYSWRSGPF